MMRAGKLKHVVIIQKRVDDVDDCGQAVDDWTDFATGVRASVEPLQGREFHAAQAAQSEVSIRFRMRYIPGVTAAMRVIWRNEFYEIEGEPINPNGRNRELHLMAKKVGS